MSVRIVPQSRQENCPANDYVRVSTCSDPGDDTVTLATIQRYVTRLRAERPTESVFVKTLVLRQPMSTDQALGLAKRYAERKNIPVVLTD